MNGRTERNYLLDRFVGVCIQGIFSSAIFKFGCIPICNWIVNILIDPRTILYFASMFEYDSKVANVIISVPYLLGLVIFLFFQYHNAGHLFVKSINRREGQISANETVFWNGKEYKILRKDKENFLVYNHEANQVFQIYAGVLIVILVKLEKLELSSQIDIPYLTILLALVIPSMIIIIGKIILSR